MREHVIAMLIPFAAGSVLAACATANAYTESRHASNRELRAEKYGRVVDAETGAGIPGVKFIVNWRTSSTGLPGLTGGGGTWCDLQKIVVSDPDGNFMIPDVSKELDISDRGTRSSMTAMGLLSVTHDTDWVISAFKPGYVGVSDLEALQRAKEGLGTVQIIPEVSFHQSKVVVKPIAMRKMTLAPTDLWLYYSIVSSTGVCSDRMANAIEQPELAEIRGVMKDIVRPMVCAMPADTALSPEAFTSYQTLAHAGRFDMPFFEKVKSLQGIAPSSRGYDPTERVSTTAGILCRVMKEEGESK